jgi:hypothetical protein
MIVNGKEYKMDDLINSIDFSSNKLIGKDNYLLTKREIEILTRNEINYKNFSSYKSLMFEIQEVLDEGYVDSDDVEELEWVLNEISERDYYTNTNK